MSKIKKTDLLQLVQEQAEMIAELSAMVELNKMSIIKLENEREKPQLKQLDQSVFDGLDEKWRFAAVDGNKGFPIVYEFEPYAFESGKYYSNHHGLYKDLTHLTGYDTSNWQNSLIEREKKGLTGSELCKAMLARGDTRVMCKVFDVDRQNDITHVIRAYHDGRFHTKANRWSYAIPINNQGEPLTASEVGL